MKENPRPKTLSAFGSRLKIAFKNASNVEIAKILGMTETAVRNYLKKRVPKAEVLILISDKTNCSIHWLLTGEGPQSRTQLKNLDGENPGEREEISGADPLLDGVKQLVQRVEKVERQQARMVSFLDNKGQNKMTIDRTRDDGVDVEALRAEIKEKLGLAISTREYVNIRSGNVANIRREKIEAVEAALENRLDELVESTVKKKTQNG
jgi:transcriptional regulator with XRE-family HTH domain